MGKRIVSLIFVLTFLFSASILANGWVNAQQEIEKSVEKNSLPSPVVNILSVSSSMTNVEKILSESGKKISPNGCGGCGQNDEPYVYVLFVNMNTVQYLLNKGGTCEQKAITYLKDALKGDFESLLCDEICRHACDNTFASIWYDGGAWGEWAQNGRLIATHSVSQTGQIDLPLSFIFVSTNSTVTVSIYDTDDLHLNNCSSCGSTLPTKFGIVSLTSTVSNALVKWAAGTIKLTEVESALFTKPTTFKRSTKSDEKVGFTLNVPNKEPALALEGLWLQTDVSKGTRAGYYWDWVTFNVHADVDDW